MRQGANPVARIAAARPLWAAAILAGLALIPTTTRSEERMTPRVVEESVTTQLASLNRATAWLNSPPLTQAGLRGKVVLVQFRTYTCINWLRTLPDIRAWAAKYKGQGLVVIGVHAPEFSFEHNLDKVRRAMSQMRIVYPIAIDNDYAIWGGFNNHYWPAPLLDRCAGACSISAVRLRHARPDDLLLRPILSEAYCTVTQMH